MASVSWLGRSSRKSISRSDMITRETGRVLHEGYAVKESGGATFGKKNWRKRWFRLVQRGETYYLEYYRNAKDLIPAGYVKLDVTYCTRPVELAEKVHPNCFAVGPMFDDGATRTYYISCAGAMEMREWMVVIDAVVQGAPEDALRRRKTVTNYFAAKRKKKTSIDESRPKSGSFIEESFESASIELNSSCEVGNAAFASDMISESLTREDVDDDEVVEDIAGDIDERECSMGLEESTVSVAGSTTTSSSILPDSGLIAEQKLLAYNDVTWRLRQWEKFCHSVEIANWTRSDTKDNITISRCRFGRSSKGFAVIKLEGILKSDPRNVFNFLQLSTKQGGKLDYLFRNEYILQEISSEPKATVIYNVFQPPLPQLSIRDVVAMKVWVPSAMSYSNKFGFVMFSVEYPDPPALPAQCTRISVGSSGIILSIYPGPNNEVHTKLTIVGQISFHGAMHKMLKGAYNSGLLKLGLRTTFTHISDQLERYLEITNI